MLIASLALGMGTSAFAQNYRRAQPVTAQTPVSTHQRLLSLAANHPFCLVVGEDLASRFVGTETIDQGPFQDQVMGALVQGTQKTTAHTSLQFSPDENAAKMLFVLKGVTANQTLAQLPQAAIRSAGTFEFELTKQIEFNGHSIRTWSPSAFMTIRQQNLGASTPVSNIPLLGPLANNIVLNAADQRKPMSEGIAAQRVTQQVAPKFNSRLDQELARLNSELKGPIKDRAVASHLYPSQISTTTTDDAVLIGMEFQAAVSAADSSGRQPLGVHKPTTTLITRQLIPSPQAQFTSFSPLTAPVPYSLDSQTLKDRACCLIHVSLVQELSDRLQLAGKEIPDTQLESLGAGGLLSAGTNSAKPKLYTLVLAKKDPLTLRVDQGEAVISIRLGIRTVLGPELPQQEIRIALRPTFTTDQIRLTPELRSIEPVEAGSENKLGDAVETMIRQGFEEKLKSFSLNRDYSIPRPNAGSPFPIRIQNFTFVDGWIALTLEQPAARGTTTAIEPIKSGEVLR